MNDIFSYLGIIVPVITVVGTPYLVHRYVKSIIAEELKETQHTVTELKREVETVKKDCVDREYHDQTFNSIKDDLHNIQQAQVAQTARLDTIFLKLTESHV